MEIPYKIKCSKEIPQGAGYWNYVLVEIFENDIKIGEYVREYPGSCETTFFPFKKDGKWYALYSSDYTLTRVMSLPDCKDVCGEVDLENDGCGFCPVDFYVPSYIIMRDLKNDKGEITPYIVDEPDEINNMDELLYFPFGFVSGCHWGDDSSMKIQFLDLSNIPNELKRDERFGYAEQAIGDLRHCVRIYADYESLSTPRIILSLMQRYEIDGKKLE